jgi:hypothetical protein
MNPASYICIIEGQVIWPVWMACTPGTPAFNHVIQLAFILMHNS